MFLTPGPNTTQQNEALRPMCFLKDPTICTSGQIIFRANKTKKLEPGAKRAVSQSSPNRVDGGPPRKAFATRNCRMLMRGVHTMTSMSRVKGPSRECFEPQLKICTKILPPGPPLSPYAPNFVRFLGFMEPHRLPYGANGYM